MIFPEFLLQNDQVWIDVFNFNFFHFQFATSLGIGACNLLFWKWIAWRKEVSSFDAHFVDHFHLFIIIIIP